MELCKHVETKFVPSGAILFRPGQIDDSIYVVRNGLLRVYIVERVTQQHCAITMHEILHQFALCTQTIYPHRSNVHIRVHVYTCIMHTIYLEPCEGLCYDCLYRECHGTERVSPETAYFI